MGPWLAPCLPAGSVSSSTPSSAPPSPLTFASGAPGLEQEERGQRGGAAERLIAVEVPALALFHVVLVVGTSGLLKGRPTTALCGSVVSPVFTSLSPDSSPLVHIQPLSLKVHLPQKPSNLPWAPWRERTRRASRLAVDGSSARSQHGPFYLPALGGLQATCLRGSALGVRHQSLGPGSFQP